MLNQSPGPEAKFCLVPLTFVTELEYWVQQSQLLNMSPGQKGLNAVVVLDSNAQKVIKGSGESLFGYGSNQIVAIFQ